MFFCLHTGVHIPRALTTVDAIDKMGEQPFNIRSYVQVVTSREFEFTCHCSWI